jgi:uncharacterized spore protein YtfJ
MSNAILSGLRDALSVRQVFGEVIEADGVAVLPAARISGGGGGGVSAGVTGVTGEGGGLGLRARPVGAFAIRDGAVRWVPAVDVNRLVVVIAVVVLAVVVIRARLARRRAAELEDG